MSKSDLIWMIGGEAGWGIQSAGEIFAKTFLKGGLHVFAETEHPSMIRGGHNTFQVRVSSEKVYSHSEYINLLVALNYETFEKHIDDLKTGGIIIYDEKDFKPDKLRDDITSLQVPLSKIAVEIGNKILRNSIAIGASVAVVDYDISILENIIKGIFKSKSADVIEMNTKAVRAGYNYVKGNYNVDFKYKVNPVSGVNNQILINGIQSFSIGAIKAGLKFYAAYPMSPSTGILHYLASKEREYNIIVRQSEDEIAAVNMVIGAMFTGVRAMAATSGGGFSLMVEALGLAGMSETPLVIINCQRPGPSTGMPTRTEQSDLRFVMHASQGEFPRVVIAPGDVKECFYEIQNAFNIAEKFQVQVIILADAFLCNSMNSVERFNTDSIEIDRGLLMSDKELENIEDYKRFEFTETGVSPRTIPSQKNGIFIATGNEHNVYGHISENKENRTNMVNKRAKKMEYIKKEIKYL
ncbi:MAG: 2-oxoacid:acceptor oxidoreductase subunit alpha, partial [Candidatus Helarchaeota archaeon]|nr:2-oxoacid:acceptor oxidoreductase subunit alpha [Candidatus Helarchaeota archaeon]